jgi:hypothetical protein
LYKSAKSTASVRFVSRDIKVQQNRQVVALLCVNSLSYESSVSGRAGRECRCSVSLFFLKTYVCVLTFAYHFFQSQSDDNGSIPQPSTRFRILDRAAVQYQYSKYGNVFVTLIACNTERCPLCNVLQPTNPTPL